METTDKPQTSLSSQPISGLWFHQDRVAQTDTLAAGSHAQKVPNRNWKSEKTKKCLQALESKQSTLSR